MDAGIRPSLRAISSVDTRMDHQKVTDAVKAAVRDERLAIVLEIESLIDGQPGLTELLDGLEKLQNRLLGDMTGKTLEAIQMDRLADYWEKSGRPESVEQAAHFRKLAADIRSGK